MGEIKTGRALQKLRDWSQFLQIKNSFGSHARFAQAHLDIFPQQCIHQHCCDVSQTLQPACSIFYELIYDHDNGLLMIAIKMTSLSNRHHGMRI